MPGIQHKALIVRLFWIVLRVYFNYGISLIRSVQARNTGVFVPVRRAKPGFSFRIGAINHCRRNRHQCLISQLRRPSARCRNPPMFSRTTGERCPKLDWGVWRGPRSQQIVSIPNRSAPFIRVVSRGCGQALAFLVVGLDLLLMDVRPGPGQALHIPARNP